MRMIHVMGARWSQKRVDYLVKVVKKRRFCVDPIVRKQEIWPEWPIMEWKNPIFEKLK